MVRTSAHMSIVLYECPVGENGYPDGLKLLGTVCRVQIVRTRYARKEHDVTDVIAPQRVAYTPDQASEAVGVSKKTIMAWMNSGKLTGYRHGHRTILITADDLLDAVKSAPEYTDDIRQ
ncbi:hypothetical protein CIP107534_00494 [Corynebacterium diphtheriae]|nr:hypothetical protein CIP107506_00465 [Corynebacterium diphtheriae]CAB0541956.1 hypothetical protein CIP107521_00663 [Corynebacterium diphtheriae]CAB0548660.1 hypothetical protein CIP107534_00494 [Corynebacterium diphtheriae]